MSKLDAFVIENARLDKQIYTVNEYITLSNLADKSVLVTITKPVDTMNEVSYESSGVVFYNALRLGLPKLNLKVTWPSSEYEKTLYNIFRNRNTFLFKFSSATNDDVEKDTSEVLITEEELTSILNFHLLYIEHSKNQIASREASEWKETRWNYALDQYISACSSTTIEQSNQLLITGLEALLVTGEGNLQYKVSLNAALMLADSYEQRTDIMDLVKKMYNLRSKATHGEIAALVKLLNKPSVYDDYFELKRIFSQLLLLTYGKSEKEIFNRLDVVLLSGPSF
ncbi:hypothetical protein [Paenibacillus sp. FSL R10-2778]|jgi:hypothetical protein|uniref:hypothetical protein n=1 Tax=Paenibacillus sp. FSL R10-2778 TaxID=2954659 RepID=UPI0031583DB3